jgi:hypothetical protein
MKAITFTALGIAAAVVGIHTSVQAQSTTTVNSVEEASSLSGTSLIGIDNRTAEDDYSKFFGVINSGSATQKNTPTPLRFNETLSLPDTPVFLQPGPEPMNGNDGAQVQVDLSSLDRQPKK